MKRQEAAQQMDPTEAEYQFGGSAATAAAAAAAAAAGDEEQAQPLHTNRSPSPPITQKTEIPTFSEETMPMQQNTYYHHQSPEMPFHNAGPSAYMSPPRAPLMEHHHHQPSYIHAAATASPPPPPLYPPQQHPVSGQTYYMPQSSYYTAQ